MTRLRSAFNPSAVGLYLLLLVVSIGTGGCASSEERARRKEASTLRLYLEKTYDPGDKTTVVPVFRENPKLIRIAKNPFLDEGHVKSARVVDVVGGFAILVEFDFHGALVLENISNSFRGRRIVIFSTFTDGRWLAAPVISHPITDGRLLFTPDATREEAERIVRGLNNVAIALGNQPKPGKRKKEDSF